MGYYVLLGQFPYELSKLCALKAHMEWHSTKPYAGANGYLSFSRSGHIEYAKSFSAQLLGTKRLTPSANTASSSER